MQQSARSIDVLDDEVREQLASQLSHFESLDAKAGVLLGFAGLFVVFAPEAGNPLIGAARLAGVVSASASLLTFLLRRYPAVDLAPLRENYLAAEPRTYSTETPRHPHGRTRAWGRTDRPEGAPPSGGGRITSRRDRSCVRWCSRRIRIRRKLMSQPPRSHDGTPPDIPESPPFDPDYSLIPLSSSPAGGRVNGASALSPRGSVPGETAKTPPEQAKEQPYILPPSWTRPDGSSLLAPL